MKLKINRLKLANLLENLNFAIDKKKNLPNLMNYKFTLNEDVMIVESTNNEIAVRERMVKDFSYDSNKEKVFVVNAKLIYDIVTKISDEQLEFDFIEENVLTISSPNNQYNINCYLLEMYPKIEIKEEGHQIDISKDEIINLIEKVSYASSESDIRPILKGINLTVSKQQVRAIATDNYRIAVATTSNANSTEQTFVVDIPAKSSSIILNLIKRNEIKNLKIFLENNTIIMNLNDGQILFKTMLLTGVYPTLENVITKKHTNQAIVNPVELKNAIERINLFATDSIKLVKLSIADSNLVLETVNSDLGTGLEKIKLKGKAETIKNIIFNIKHIQDVLKTIEDKEIQINYTNKNEEIAIESSGKVDVKHIVFPLKR
jgi:DNA polymerase-3 subunit beta